MVNVRDDQRDVRSAIAELRVECIRGAGAHVVTQRFDEREVRGHALGVVGSPRQHHPTCVHRTAA
jgi:hypothetical protein